MLVKEFIDNLNEKRNFKLNKDKFIADRCKTIKKFIEELDMELYAKYILCQLVDHEVLVANGYVELALNHFVINKNNKQENNLDDADFNTYTALFEMLDSDVIDIIDRQPRERAVFRVSEVVFLEDYIKNTLIAGVAPHLHKMGLKTKIVGDKTSKVTDGYYRISLGEKR